ncbi:MAG: phosphoglycerate dehydrogenase [Planctomycetia bacterium]|nr:phosphoglycerate dehydrogenase [Planctomycetia bacterium]
MPRIVVLDTLSDEGLDLLKASPGVEFEVRTGLKGDDLRQTLAEFDGAICRSGVKITAESLAGNKRLRAIVRAGVGTDNIDKQAATRLGIVVMNTPAGNTISTAEHTFAMMLALSRSIAPANQSLIEHRWERGKFMGAQLADKTLGVIGLGRIGQAVAARAKAFEMKVLGFDPFLSAEKTKELGIEPVESVHAMLPQVDYLTVHTPLTPETKHLVGKKELDLLKPGVRLVNCARGDIYDEAALLEGLKAGKIGGVALDVFAQEPCTDSPLFGQPGVLCTPHLGASTEEAQAKVAVEGVGLLVDYLTTGAIRHAVNMSTLDPKTLEAMRGYLDLSYRLGLLLSQFDRSGIRSCKLFYRGDIVGKDTKLLGSAFAAGLLASALDQEANIVNAELLLRERGIELVEQSRADRGAFNATIAAEVTTATGAYRAAGTLFGQKMLRLVELNEFRLEAYLDGILLVFRHRDVPGIIGRVGTIFGQHQVNIAQMSVGRTGEAPGGDSIGVMNLDGLPPEAAMEAIRKSPDILGASIIQLPPAGQLPSWLA